MVAPAKLEIMYFKSSTEFRRWLAKNHSQSDGIWLRIYKKNSGTTTVTYKEALDQALCFGWIDGQKKPCDENSWLQKFTPRRSKSSWSKNNTRHAERLIKSKEMTSAGLKEVNSAKADGRWKRAYASPSEVSIPGDFLKAVSKNKKALAFFRTLNKANLYSIAYRLQTAKKPETRAKRMKMILEMMLNGEKFH